MLTKSTQRIINQFGIVIFLIVNEFWNEETCISLKVKGSLVKPGVGRHTDMVTQTRTYCSTLLLHCNFGICIIIPSTRIPCGLACKLYCKITSLRLQTESQWEECVGDWALFVAIARCWEKYSVSRNIVMSLKNYSGMFSVDGRYRDKFCSQNICVNVFFMIKLLIAWPSFNLISIVLGVLDQSKIVVYPDNIELQIISILKFPISCILTPFFCVSGNFYGWILSVGESNFDKS